MEPGAPQFVDKYTVYRLGNNKGFRTIGEIGQDLDLFNMPVELRIETEGKTEDKRVDVVGTNSEYVVDTFGRPRHIAIDPDELGAQEHPGYAGPGFHFARPATGGAGRLSRCAG